MFGFKCLASIKNSAVLISAWQRQTSIIQTTNWGLAGKSSAFSEARYQRKKPLLAFRTFSFIVYRCGDTASRFYRALVGDSGRLWMTCVCLESGQFLNFIVLYKKKIAFDFDQMRQSQICITVENFDIIDLQNDSLSRDILLSFNLADK